MEQSLKINSFYDLFLNFIKDEIEFNGVSMVKELVYRFAMVQFRDTKGFSSGNIEYIPKIFANMQTEFGGIFEQFANTCFENGHDIEFINNTVKEWLLEILKETLPQE